MKTWLQRLLCLFGLHYWSYRQTVSGWNPKTRQFEFKNGHKRCGRCNVRKDYKP